jgi:hypothetical protein
METSFLVLRTKGCDVKQRYGVDSARAEMRAKMNSKMLLVIDVVLATGLLQTMKVEFSCIFKTGTQFSASGQM